MRLDLFDFFLFIYFFSLHADQLGFTFGGYHFRANNLIAAFLVLFLILRFRPKVVFLDKKLFLPLVFMTAALFLSFLFSPYKSRCAIFFGWYGFTLVGYVFLPLALLSFGSGYKFFSSYLVSFLAVGVYALMQLAFSCLGIKDPYASQTLFAGIMRPNAFAYEPSFYALYMTPFIMMCNFHYLFSKQEAFFCLGKINVKKLFFINTLYSISCSAAVIFAYALFFFCVGIFSHFHSLKKEVFKFVGTFCCACLCLFGVAPFLIKNFFFKFFFLGFLSHLSFYVRWMGIKNAWNVFCKNKLCGVGLGGFPPYLMDAFLTNKENDVNFVKSTADLLAEGHDLKIFEPTNVFTEILASLGIIGLLAFSYFVYSVIAQAYTGRHRIFNVNLLISTIVMLGVLQFNQGLLRTYVWLHLTLVFALVSGSNLCFLPNQDKAKVQGLF